MIKRFLSLLLLWLLVYPVFGQQLPPPRPPQGNQPATATPRPLPPPTRTPEAPDDEALADDTDAPKGNEYVADDLGFRFEYPDDWPAFEFDVLQETYSVSNDEDTLAIVVLLVEEEITNLASFARFYYPNPGIVQPAQVDDESVAEFDFVMDDGTNADGMIAGRGMAFYRPNAETGVIITVQTTDVSDLDPDAVRSMTPTPLDLLYEQVRDTLDFFGPRPEDSNSLAEREFSSPDFGFSLTYPLVWDDMRYERDDRWFITLDNTGTQAIYVYNVGTGHDDAEDVAAALIDDLGMTQESDFSAVTLGAYDGVEFTFSYKFNGTWYGKATAIVLDGNGLVFSVEMLAEEAQVAAFYERFIRTVRFLE